MSTRRPRFRWRLIVAAVALLATVAGCGSDDQSSTPTVEASPGSDASTDPESSSGTEASASTEASTIEVAITAAEIEAALAGNTIIGNWVGEDYRQFFDESGDTTYVPVDGQASFGQWRVDVSTDRYESLWPGARQWDAYEVHRDGDQWFWTGGGVERSPFTIVDGNQLDG